ncbi:neurogenic locus Notch isoform X3 [Brachionus plicatilis]|uniref:Neurogenic locus Notch isoform X3 n=1 Tax=Brachionus plicatilis TaxID=10195 RepID=A0A3M7R1G2_BRAPC|nr:neurogenic locus Notch isoform X3 [Brachionus plicatilis]
MNKNFLVLLIQFNIFLNVSINGQMFISGSEDKTIKIFENNKIQSSLNVDEKILSVGVLKTENKIVVGRQNMDVIVWNFQDNLKVSADSSETVYSILILNDTHFIAGYSGKIIFWSIDLRMKMLVENDKFNYVVELKRLEEDKILIASSNGRIFAYSLKENKSLIAAKCLLKICILNLNEDNMSKCVNKDTFISGDDKGYIKLWNSSSMQLIKDIYYEKSDKITILSNMNKLTNFEYLSKHGSNKHTETKDSTTRYFTINSDEINTKYHYLDKKSTSSILETRTKKNQELSIQNEKTTITTITTRISFYTDDIFSPFNELYRLTITKLNLDINSCLTNCSGNGKCKLTNSLKFECECFANYAGPHCQINSLPCYSNPCRNNGTCIDDILKKIYQCDCFFYANRSSLFYGRNCENKINLCQNETCSGNGVCHDYGYEAKCRCFQKYYGEKCQIESNEIRVIKTSPNILNVKKKSFPFLVFLNLITAYKMNFTRIGSVSQRNKFEFEFT